MESLASPFIAELSNHLSDPILCPLLGSIILLGIPDSGIRLIRSIGLCASLMTFPYSLGFWIQFENSTAKFQFVETIRWLPHSNINLVLGVDGIPSFLVVLTTSLIPIRILAGWSSIKRSEKEYIIALSIGESSMIAVSRMLDILLFHVFLESVLIPMLCGAEPGDIRRDSALCRSRRCAVTRKSEEEGGRFEFEAPLAKPSVKGSLVCKHSIFFCRTRRPKRNNWRGSYAEWVPRGKKTSLCLLEYCMDMQDRVLLSGEERPRGDTHHYGRGPVPSGPPFAICPTYRGSLAAKKVFVSQV